MQIPPAKLGEEITVNKKIVPFSYWPMHPTRSGRHSLQSTIFSLDPWTLITQTIENSCMPAAKDEALACAFQAKGFFESAVRADALVTRPLLLYYSNMNLVKAFCLTRGTRTTFNKAQHGLSEKLGAGGIELKDAYLEAYPSSTSGTTVTLNNFSEFMLALTGSPLSTKTSYEIPKLLPQIVPGHRLWAQAAGEDERFIHLYNLKFLQDKVSKQIWIRIYMLSEDLTRLHMTRSSLLTGSGLPFKQVATAEKVNGRPLICFEQNIPITYSGYPADRLNSLADSVKPYLWATVSTVKPFRRYYLYKCPAPDVGCRLPQLLSIYALSYYLGSITRYRPHQYPSIARGPFGPRVQDFITGQPYQFLYLMASEFSKQEVSRPAIV
jgi:hypothetical protein